MAATDKTVFKPPSLKLMSNERLLCWPQPETSIEMQYLRYCSISVEVCIL